METNNEMIMIVPANIKGTDGLNPVEALNRPQRTENTFIFGALDLLLGFLKGSNFTTQYWFIKVD